MGFPFVLDKNSIPPSRLISKEVVLPFPNAYLSAVKPKIEPYLVQTHCFLSRVREFKRNYTMQV